MNILKSIIFSLMQYKRNTNSGYLPGGGHGVAVNIIGTIGFRNKSANSISRLQK